MSGKGTGQPSPSEPSESSEDSDEQPDVAGSATVEPMSDHDWLQVLSPKISSRNFKESFYWVPFVRETVLHLFHPFFTPFANLSSICNWFYFVVLIHVVVWLLFVLAFVPSLGKQDYTHEAIFLLAFKIVWSCAVGVKYGFYSLPLQHVVTKTHVPSVFIASEQIVSNWRPKLERLMFELRVASSHAPVPMGSLFMTISSKHPAAIYCQKCNEVGDVPLCLLQPSLVSDLMAKLPNTNFHKVFWSKPPAFIEADGKEYQDISAYVEVASYKPFLPEGELKTMLPKLAGSADNTSFVAVDLSAPQSSKIRRRVTLNSRAKFLSVADCSKRHPQTSPSPSTDYVCVSASVLVAYCVCRCWNFGSKWIGDSFFDHKSRAWIAIQFLNVVQYAAPGVMRVLEPSICSRLNCGSMCRGCPGFEPVYVGYHWADIVCHVCWAIGSLFWFRLLVSFIAINMFELLRRAKLTEEWADTLRHGRDSSFSTGMRLTSKEAVMNWYYCREVLRRFRSKMHVRLTAVTFFIFLVPACSLSALGVGLYDSAAVPATGVTPKFFVQTLLYATVFMSAVVLVVFFGAKQNKAARHENLMFAQLIAHVQFISCSKNQKDDGISAGAVDDVRDGLITVHNTLKTIHGMDPEKIFFILPANLTILTTIASGFAVVATALFQRVTSEPCSILAGVEVFYKTHDITC